MQDGDVLSTCADCQDLSETIVFSPNTEVEYGVKQFVDWYLSYYKINNISLIKSKKKAI